MKTITVFTPTYNRAYCLHLLYDSLCRQTSQDFLWLLIDDGSTDNTKQLVEAWIKEDKIEIQYKYKENGGMHTGHNAAYELINTELNVCIDSDDYMTDNAVERIISLWRGFGNESYAGIVGLDADIEGAIIGIPFPEYLKDCTYSELKPKYKVIGDKKSVYRTDVIKKYDKYPTFLNEKFVGLYLPIVIDCDYKVLCYNEVFCIVDYKNDGSTLNIFHQYIKNPNGFAHYRKILMHYNPFLFEKFRNAIHYISSVLLLKDKFFLKNNPSKTLTIFAIPFGVILYFFILFKTKKTM